MAQETGRIAEDIDEILNGNVDVTDQSRAV